jgi:hypothetical protein
MNSTVQRAIDAPDGLTGLFGHGCITTGEPTLTRE